MTTQISFTADELLKKSVMEKAKRRGLTLKSVLIFAMEAFLEDRIKLGIITEEPEVERIYFDSDSINSKAKEIAKLLK